MNAELWWLLFVRINDSHNELFCNSSSLNRHLFLNNNRLTGTIPPAIDNLHLAEQIYLGQNKFNGTLPINIGNNRPNNWRFFSVYDNKLTGILHEGMKLANAFMLDFSRNGFYGTIPNDIDNQNYTTLRLLYLDHNSLTGTIPPSLMQIKKMKGLFLNDNRKYQYGCDGKLFTMHLVTDSFTCHPIFALVLQVSRVWSPTISIRTKKSVC